jgi:hypothetical protein
MKKCSKCHETKELTEFYKHRAGKDGVDSTCKICIKSQAKQWQIDNPEKSYATKRKYAKKIQGVYAIYENNKCLYVGESNQVIFRTHIHKSRIKNPESARTHKQLYYNLQQHINIEFKILEETSNHKEREQYWINKLKPKYNA